MGIKKICFLLLLESLIFNLKTSFGQGGVWTWISGDSALNSLGVYGTQGVPSINNQPPGLYEYAEWKDKQGNFWLYGGTDKNTDAYSDLWKFNPLTLEWTWVKGNGLTNQYAYGVMGIPSLWNTPGGRIYSTATWVDSSGGLWLFGGNVSDLWKYNISANEWTWVTGSRTNGSGIHGTLGVSSPANTPGARDETSSAWTDSLNNLWLFGGWGYDDGGDFGSMNDLFRYNISNNEWTWMKGSDSINVAANYGIKGTSNSFNDPGGRWTYTKWKDLEGNFWIMGGGLALQSYLNDVWKYDLAMNEWTWESGTNVPFDTGNYNANCLFDTINTPYSRYENRSSVTDSCGRFWMFGGRNYHVSYFFNDLWLFEPQNLKWNLVNGNNIPNQNGNYGVLGVPSPSNMPPARCGADAWWGNDNKFYLFGGRQDTGVSYSKICYGDMWVFNPDTTCTPFCSAATVSPVTNFQSDKTKICAYDCINFTDLSTNATSWQWSFAGATDSTSTAQNPQNVCYQTAGIYNVTLVASNSGGSNTAIFNNYLTVSPAPPTPVITQHNDTLYCSTDSSYISYQWYSDSTLISGATDSLFVYKYGGNYNIKVSNKYGCNVAVGINIVGIKEFTAYGLQFTLSPNPVSDELLISGNPKSETAKLTIYNILGEEIYSNIINRKQETINCKPFSSGIYFVQVVSESGRWVGKFVKQ